MLEGDAARGSGGDIGPLSFDTPIKNLDYMRRYDLAARSQGVQLRAHHILLSRGGDCYDRKSHHIAGITIVGCAYCQDFVARNYLAHAINATNQPCIALWHAGLPPVAKQYVPSSPFSCISVD